MAARPQQFSFQSRGNVRLPTFRAASRPFAVKWPAWRWGALLFALLMFGQTFQYLIDVPPLYLGSKIWPLLTLPLAGWALLRLPVPHRILVLVTLVWVIGVAPFVGIFQLGNSAKDALATTVKAWAFVYPFSILAALVILRPTPSMLEKALYGLGVGLFSSLAILWVAVPGSKYTGGDETTKLFMFDLERGYHLFMPMFFGLLLIFALNRSFWICKRAWKLVAMTICFVLLFVIYKERATIAGGALVVVLGSAFSLRRTRPAVLAIGALLGCLGLIFLLTHLQSTALESSLGGSLSVRRNSMASAISFLSADPWRWVIGAGATSRVGDVSLFTLMNSNQFYLADIGWLGIVFEYGLIGAFLIAGLHLVALHTAYKSARATDAMSLALGDYILFVLAVSPVYSVMFTPGDVMTCWALCAYFSLNRRTMQATRINYRDQAATAGRFQLPAAIPRRDRQLFYKLHDSEVSTKRP